MIKEAIIHPMWLIEEKAKIFRVEVWFSPPVLPARAESVDKVAIALFGIFIKDIKNNGDSFCKVNSIKRIFILRFSATEGSQKCKGARASFRVRGAAINKFDMFKVVSNIIWIKAKEAHAWIMKYFKEVFVEVFDKNMRGKNINIFNSSPNQAINQEEEERVIKIPIKVPKKNIKE